MMRKSFLWAVLGTLLLAGPVLAQSFLGTIRGTVLDPQGLPLPGASVTATDETTNIARTVPSDASGNFEISNLRPGNYRVEVSLEGFRKVERPGVVLSAASVARVDARLEVGALAETVTVTAEGKANITMESPAIARGLDAQQIRDLPRASRDIQDFLYLNPNVVGGGDTDLQFLGGRTYGVTYIQDGQASTNAIFGTVGNSAPGVDAISEMQVLSNSYSAEYGGLAGVVVTTKRGGNAYHGTAFYDFNDNSLNALTYSQKLTGATRGRPQRRHLPAPLGRELRRSHQVRQDLLLRELRGAARPVDHGRRPGHRADRGHAQRRLLGRDLQDQGPAHGTELPRERHPGQPDRPRGHQHHQLLLPPAQPDSALHRLGHLPEVHPRDPQPPAGGPADRPRGLIEGLPLRPGQLPGP